MYIAKVAPISKIPRSSRQIFSYFTSQKLKEGSLVLVPFGKKEIPAIVFSQKKAYELKQEIKNADFQLRPISKIIEKNPVLCKNQLSLAKWISYYYISSIGKTLSLFLPKHLLKKIENKKIKNYFIKTEKFPKKKSNKNKKPKLIISSSGELPQKDIKNALSKKSQILFLIPEKSKKNWEKKLKKFSSKISFVSGGLPSKKSLEVFEKIKNKDAEIIIGTRSSIFSPFSNLGLIIISEEENKNYKSEKEPRYDARKSASILAKLWKADLIFLSSFPSSELYFETEKGFVQKIKTNEKDCLPSISLIDMKKLKKWQPISETLFDAIKNNVEKNKKILLFVNRKGESSTLLCQDCGWIKKCDNCGIPFTIYAKKMQNINLEKIMICNHCGKEKKVSEFCEKCGSWKLMALGAGTDKIESIIQKKFSKVPVLKLDNSISNKKKDQKKIIETFLKEKNCILITTSLIFQYADIDKVDLVGIVSIDNILSLPDFRAEENVIKIIKKLEMLSSKDLLIQTFWPKSKAFYQTKEKYNILLENTLIERKKFLYPPFSSLIKLTISCKDNKIACKETDKIKKMLKNFAPKEIKYELLGPVLINTIKIKGNYSWQILVKIKNDIKDDSASQNKKIIKKLLKKTSLNWSIDVDPINIP